MERYVQRGDQLARCLRFEKPLLQPYGAGGSEGGFPARLHAYGECGLHAVYRLYERLRQPLHALQRLRRQEDRGRRERHVQSEQGIRPHDGFGMDAERHEQRDRPLLYGAVYLQSAPLRQERLHEYQGLRRHGTPGRPPSDGARRPGRSSSVPSAVTFRTGGTLRMRTGRTSFRR